MLLIDAGNTRCKFAWWDKHTDSIQWLGAIEHQHWLNDLSRSLKVGDPLQNLIVTIPGREDYLKALKCIRINPMQF